MNATLEMVPSADRLVDSLRDIGYDLESAVADIVDNSVDAGAEAVNIDLHHAGAKSWIRLCDDGVGMTEKGLSEAMRYGSRQRYREDDLGRYGLGLKTASLSQCRRLTVASRTSLKGRVAVRVWDLDLVRRTDRWKLQRLTPSEAPGEAIDPLRGQTGTVVLWEVLDRVEAFAYPEGARAAAALNRDAGALREHLAVVFHRFLDGSAEGPPLQIVVNDEPVVPWDPFCRDEPGTQRLPLQRLTYHPAGGSPSRVSVQPFILPPRPGFSSAEAHERAAGPKRWNRQQGLYIYRNDRLIQSGGWNRIRTMDEHSKLARVAVDIPCGSEADWRLSVSKMTVGLPEELRPELRTLVGSVISRAKEAYRSAHADTKEESDSAAARRPQPLDGERFRLADHWTAISEVLAAELGDDRERLNRILVRLINSRYVREGKPGRSDAAA